MGTNVAESGLVLRQLSVSGRALRVLRFFRRWPVVSGTIVVLLVVIAIFAPLIAPHSPIDHDITRKNLPPAWSEKGSNTYLLGTDTLGRDLLSRIIYGARVSLTVAAVSLLSGTVIATFLAITAGYFGGVVDEIISRIVDIWLGLPFIMVALILYLALGGSLATIAILLVLLAWTGGYRNVRAEVLSLKTRDYVLMAKVVGASTRWIFLKHLLPGVLNTVIVLATLRVSSLILAEAFLSFLGAGIPPPTPSWGNMIAEGRSYLRDAWWISVFPGIALILTSAALSFLGDWIRDFTDPRLRHIE